LRKPFPDEDEDGEYQKFINSNKFKKLSDEEILKAHSTEPMINGMAIVNPEKMEHYFVCISRTHTHIYILLCKYFY